MILKNKKAVQVLKSSYPTPPPHAPRAVPPSRDLHPWWCGQPCSTPHADLPPHRVLRRWSDVCQRGRLFCRAVVETEAVDAFRRRGDRGPIRTGSRRRHCLLPDYPGEPRGRSHEFESRYGRYPAPAIGQAKRVRGDPRSGEFSEFSLAIAVLTIIVPILLGFGTMALGWATYERNKPATQSAP
jgi:hypothetical protein